ncbi:hypothetical protein B0J18DRAFT_438447 [Chaetomium sp. MPI-SDFR-AT-0129]|nr:hypothetical protein B0J18DRAFT_438447 [Chaetomium sp. MPI-SDFR-AT-0129]
MAVSPTLPRVSCFTILAGVAFAPGTSKYHSSVRPKQNVSVGEPSKWIKRQWSLSFSLCAAQPAGLLKTAIHPVQTHKLFGRLLDTVTLKGTGKRVACR